MVDFARSPEWTEADLLALVSEGVEENLNLDYKACPSLQRREPERREISKDVSAFANSAGGVIVYGMNEETHKPTSLDQGYDPGDISKEWVEQVIQGNIRPRISGVHINSVELSRTRGVKVAYVVTVPQGKTAHQASDLKYYKRFNFESVAMYDHEIRDVMARFVHPLVIASFSASLLSRQDRKYKLNIVLENQGASCTREVKLVFFWPPSPLAFDAGGGFTQRPVDDSVCTPPQRNTITELSVRRTATIFPEDEMRLTDNDSTYYFTFQIGESVLEAITASRKPLLVWRVYADSMPPQTGSVSIEDLINPVRPVFTRYRYD